MVTLREVTGAPVAGLYGAARRTPPAAVPFRHLLERTMAAARPQNTGAIRPAALRAAPTVRQPSGTKQALAATIRHAAATVGVEPALSVAVARAESSLDPSARSPDGVSVGTFQMTRPTTADMRRRFATGTVERPPGADDVALGVGYLRYLHDVFGRSAQLGRGLQTVPVVDTQERRLFTVAAFNAGEGRVARAQAQAASIGLDPTRFHHVRPFLPAITQRYVDRVTTYARDEATVSV